MSVELSQATADDVNFLWDVLRDSMKDYITRARGEWNEQREKYQFRHQLQLSAAQVIRSNDLEVGFIMGTHQGWRPLDSHCLHRSRASAERDWN